MSGTDTRTGAAWRHLELVPGRLRRGAIQPGFRIARRRESSHSWGRSASCAPRAGRLSALPARVIGEGPAPASALRHPRPFPAPAVAASAGDQREDCTPFRIDPDAARPGTAEHASMAVAAIDALLDEVEAQRRLPFSRVDELSRKLGLGDEDVDRLYEELDARGVEVWDDTSRPEPEVTYANGALVAARRPRLLCGGLRSPCPSTHRQATVSKGRPRSRSSP